MPDLRSRAVKIAEAAATAHSRYMKPAHGPREVQRCWFVDSSRMIRRTPESRHAPAREQVLLPSMTLCALWPDHTYRRAVLTGVCHHVGGPAVGPCGLAVPHRVQLVRVVDHDLACFHV